MNNKVFYQHPNLMRALGMHETVMEVMVNVLGGGGDSKVTVMIFSLFSLFILFSLTIGIEGLVRHLTSLFECALHSVQPTVDTMYLLTFFPQEIRFPQMVTNCCRFLCYFCRISRQNQRSMFDHLSYLLQNSGIGLGQCQTPITLFSIFLFYGFICIYFEFF